MPTLGPSKVGSESKVEGQLFLTHTFFQCTFQVKITTKCYTVPQETAGSAVRAQAGISGHLLFSASAEYTHLYWQRECSFRCLQFRHTRKLVFGLRSSHQNRNSNHNAGIRNTKWNATCLVKEEMHVVWDKMQQLLAGGHVVLLPNILL